VRRAVSSAIPCSSETDGSLDCNHAGHPQVLVADAGAMVVADTKPVFVADAKADVRRRPQQPIAAL
jgi:hypothetical protein